MCEEIQQLCPELLEFLNLDEEKYGNIATKMRKLLYVLPSGYIFLRAVLSSFTNYPKRKNGEWIPFTTLTRYGEPTISIYRSDDNGTVYIYNGKLYTIKTEGFYNFNVPTHRENKYTILEPVPSC